MRLIPQEELERRFPPTDDPEQLANRRQLTLSADDEARIETCTDHTVLDRWLDQALFAASTGEALR